MNTYKAEFEDGNFEIFVEATHEDAIEEAFKMEEVHGTLYNVEWLDEDYDVIETIH